MSTSLHLLPGGGSLNIAQFKKKYNQISPYLEINFVIVSMAAFPGQFVPK